MTTRIRIHLILIVSLLALVVVLPSLTLAAPATSEVLPPRPSPMPTSVPTPTKPPSQTQPVVGAFIILHVTPAPTGVWTVVQWQDALGGWHNVEGWQGTLDDIQKGGQTKQWWVAPKDFATGPFRWVVYQGKDGKMLGFSEPFDLPQANGATVPVKVTLAP